MVSIVIPVYNTETLIARCLESVLSQTYPDIEVICVDDGSTDSSLSILASYAERDPRVRVVAREHSGVSGARNAGLRAAQGTYLAFVDSDDFVTPDYIARLVDAIEGTGSADAPTASVGAADQASGDADSGPVDIAFIGLRGFERDEVTASDTSETVLQKSLEGRIRFTDRLLENRTSKVTEVPNAKIFMLLLTGIACKIFRTELIHARDGEAEPTCFPETYLYGEDTAFTLLYMRDAYTMRTTDGIGYYYCRRKGNSLSYNNTVTMRKILDLIRLWENAFGGRWTKELREIYNQEVCVLLSSYLIRISRMDLPYDQQKTLFLNAIRQAGMDRVMKETHPHDKKTLLLFTAIRLRSYRLFWAASRFLPSNVRFVTDPAGMEEEALDR